jgi:hypothetical protein
MKTYLLKIAACLFFVSLVLSQASGARAQEQTGTRGASSYQAAEETPFTLIILGTRNSDDVTIVKQNFSKLPTVKKFVPSLESQKHIEFVGFFTGSADSLAAEAKGLAGDRFETGSKNDKNRGLVITMRKIQP